MAKRLLPLRRVGLAVFLLVHALVYRLIAWAGYTFVPASDVLQVLVAMTLIIALTVDGIKCSHDQTEFSKTINDFLPLFVLFFIRAVSIHSRGALYFLLYIVSFVCGLVLMRKRKGEVTHGTIKGTVVKVSVLASYVALSVQLLLLLLPSGYTGVRQAERSPSGVYLVEIIENSHGAMGGNTRINITRLGINIGIGELRAHPQNIYHGRWSDSQVMVPSWETDEVLYILDVRDPAYAIMRFERQGRDWRQTDG